MNPIMLVIAYNAIWLGIVSAMLNYKEPNE